MYLSKLNIIETIFYICNRQVFCLYRLNKQRFPTLKFYFKFGLNRIPVYSRFSLERFYCILFMSVITFSTFDKIMKKMHLL